MLVLALALLVDGRWEGRLATCGSSEEMEVVRLASSAYMELTLFSSRSRELSDVLRSESRVGVIFSAASTSWLSNLPALTSASNRAARLLGVFEPSSSLMATSPLLEPWALPDPALDGRRPRKVAEMGEVGLVKLSEGESGEGDAGDAAASASAVSSSAEVMCSSVSWAKCEEMASRCTFTRAVDGLLVGSACLSTCGVCRTLQET